MVDCCWRYTAAGGVRCVMKPKFYSTSLLGLLANNVRQSATESELSNICIAYVLDHQFVVFIFFRS